VLWPGKKTHEVTSSLVSVVLRHLFSKHLAYTLQDFSRETPWLHHLLSTSVTKLHVSQVGPELNNLPGNRHLIPSSNKLLINTLSSPSRDPR